MDYNNLVFRIGGLCSALKRCQEQGLFQGEHTITHTDADGNVITIYAHIDGTDFQFYTEQGNKTGLNMNMEAKNDDR